MLQSSLDLTHKSVKQKEKEIANLKKETGHLQEENSSLGRLHYSRIFGLNIQTTSYYRLLFSFPMKSDETSIF